MDWILALIAAALSAAGTGASMAGASKARNEANQRTLEEMARQQGVQQKASQEFAKSLEGSTQEVAQQQMQQGTQERQGLYDKLQGIPLTTQGSNVLASTDSATTLRDLSQMQLANRSRAKLGGYETWLLDQAVKNLRATQNLGLLNQQAQQSQAILPMELQNAAYAGQNLQGIGGLLGTAGSLMGLYGASTQASAPKPKVPVSGYGWMEQ